MSPIITLRNNAKNRPGVQFVVAEITNCGYWTLHFSHDGYGEAYILVRALPGLPSVPTNKQVAATPPTDDPAVAQMLSWCHGNLDELKNKLGLINEALR